MSARAGIRDRDVWIYALVGFCVWLSGAVNFRLGGTWLFESGPWVTTVAALIIALLVCLIFRSTLRWRGTSETDALTVAVVMLLPGLFGEAMRQIVFHWATGLKSTTQPAFAASVIFGNSVLMTYALWKQWRARRNL
jgi:hypothetical protein